MPTAVILTLAGDPSARATHALEVARHQVRVAQSDAPVRLEATLVDAADAVSEQIGRIRNAVDDVAAEAAESGEAERQRREWFPRIHAA